MSSYLTKLLLKYPTSEEKQVAQILYDDTVEIALGDQRLNLLAAHSYNAGICEKIFVMLEKALDPTENQWKTLLKALLILHTVVLYGSELAVDKAIDICKYAHPLQEYNSALVKKSSFFSLSSGGTDYGGPVRTEARIVVPILMSDVAIRRARSEARGGQNTLVPVGERPVAPTTPMQFNFGQGVSSRVGAGFGLEAVPGMYEGRPDRYFDNANDVRSQNTTTGDHQFTRDAQAPSLLDLAFDNVATTELPEAQYLPALEKQAQLERQLREQQAELARLQALAAQQQQMHQLQMMGQPQQSLGFQAQPTSAIAATQSPFDSLLGDMTFGPAPAPTASIDFGQNQVSPAGFPSGQQAPPSTGVGYGISQPPVIPSMSYGMGQQVSQPSGINYGMGLQVPQSLGMAYGLSQQQPAQPGMSYGMSQQPPQPANIGLGFGQQVPPSTNMGYGMGQQPPALPGMGYGTAPQVPQQQGMGYVVGQQAPQSFGMGYGMGSQTPQSSVPYSVGLQQMPQPSMSQSSMSYGMNQSQQPAMNYGMGHTVGIGGGAFDNLQSDNFPSGPPPPIPQMPPPSF